MKARAVTLRPARWRQRAVAAVLGVAAPVIVAMLILHAWWWAAGAAAWTVAGARWLRRWPWIAGLLFWLELRKTRHVQRDGKAETQFAWPLTAPLERRRPVPKEPRMRAARRGD